jgi:hypothetical protein
VDPRILDILPDIWLKEKIVNHNHKSPEDTGENQIYEDTFSKFKPANVKFTFKFIRLRTMIKRLLGHPTENPAVLCTGIRKDIGPVKSGIRLDAGFLKGRIISPASLYDFFMNFGSGSGPDIKKVSGVRAFSNFSCD